jgi:hypothetical protein
LQIIRQTVYQGRYDKFAVFSLENIGNPGLSKRLPMLPKGLENESGRGGRRRIGAALPTPASAGTGGQRASRRR